MKTAGQIAYEADCKRQPLYPNGDKRCDWEKLDTVAKWSWERKDTGQ